MLSKLRASLRKNRCFRPRGDIPRGLSTLVVGIIMMGSPSFAAGTVGEQPHDAPIVAPDPDLAGLLRKVEQQIVAGHTLSPPDDNAVATWKQVLRLTIGATKSPGVHGALADFATHMRNQAADEMTAGRQSVADDLNVFAVQASRLVWHIDPGPADNSQASGPRTASASPVPPAPPPRGPANGVTWRDAPSVEPLASAVPPPARQTVPDPPAAMQPGRPPAGRSAPNTSPVAPASYSAGVTVAPLDMTLPPAQLQLAADLYARRGDEMLATRDIMAARKFYGYAAIAGNARAAIALAGTFSAELVARPETEPETPRHPGLHHHRVHVSRIKTPVPVATPPPPETTVR